MQERRANPRLARAYHVQYGPVSSVVHSDQLRPGTLHDLSAGGVSFSGPDAYPVGTQLFVHISVSGWCSGPMTIQKVDDPHASLPLKTIVEVVRVQPESEGSSYRIAATFLGRVTENAGSDRNG